MEKLGVVFGGKTPEHNVSIISGISIIKNINKQKYSIKPIYISEEGIWYECTKNIEPEDMEKTKEELKKNLGKIENVLEYLKELDLIFPVIHGKNGEDGSIQGMFEILNKKYVGCKVLASSIGMDKIYTKAILEKAQIPQAKYVYIKANNGKYIYVDKEYNETIYNTRDITRKIIEELKLPVFVKPSNSGSSIGITKAKTIEEVEKSIKEAQKYDHKIIIEEEIKGRELECAVLGNEQVLASGVGEILPTEEFYSYNAKYKNAETKTEINAKIPNEIKEQIQKLAIKAFKAIDGKGLSRVDFFWNEEKNKIYINEINTMPGFTEISMYAKLWKEAGLSYEELLEKLIELSKE